MKKWLWIAALVIGGAYFAKEIRRMLEKLPVVGNHFISKDSKDLTPG